VPQSLSTDPRIGQLSLKAALLYDRLWINADDQGRLSGNPDEIKYATCPNIDQVAKSEIPELLNEMEAAGLIKIYTTSKQKAIQMLDWWEEQKLQWAYPSRYPPPEGWTDHLRYHPTPKEIITENWPPSDQSTSELLPSKLPSQPANSLPSKLQSDKESSKEITEKQKEKEEGKRRGSLPSALGSRSPPSPGTQIEIYNKFVECFENGWGLKTTGKVLAQIRDFSLTGWGCLGHHLSNRSATLL